MNLIDDERDLPLTEEQRLMVTAELMDALEAAGPDLAQAIRLGDGTRVRQQTDALRVLLLVVEYVDCPPPGPIVLDDSQPIDWIKQRCADNLLSLSVGTDMRPRMAATWRALADHFGFTTHPH